MTSGLTTLALARSRCTKCAISLEGRILAPANAQHALDARDHRFQSRRDPVEDRSLVALQAEGTDLPPFRFFGLILTPEM